MLNNSTSSNLNMLIKNKSFILFTIGQGVSNLGDTFHLIAVTMLLYNMTGSGLSAAFGIICAPIPSILLSPIAGSLGDRFSSKKLLFIIDLLRGLVALSFMFKLDVYIIYILLFILSSLNVMYNPPCKKIIVQIMRDNEFVFANSILSGVSGASFLVGPIFAGIIIGLFGVNIAFIANSCSFIFSGFTILTMRVRNLKDTLINSKKSFYDWIKTDLKEGFKYLQKIKAACNLVMASTVICFGTAAMNMAFYPFAFDVLKVGSGVWGLMISIFYGTSLISMLISMYINRQANKKAMLYINISLFIVSVIWLYYSVVENIAALMFLQLIEGTALSLFGILVTTGLQTEIKKSFVSRIMGLNDILNNAGKLLGILLAFIILQFSSPRIVFLINSILLMLFAVYKLMHMNSTVIPSENKNSLTGCLSRENNSSNFYKKNDKIGKPDK